MQAHIGFYQVGFHQGTFGRAGGKEEESCADIPLFLVFGSDSGVCRKQSVRTPDQVLTMEISHNA